MRNITPFLLVFLAACARPPLKVGTTGDYRPFSLWQGSQPEGADIAMAKAYAKAQGREVVFVRTKWTTLLEDLHAGWFDLAMSGITITEQREREAAFSRPYFQGYKVAVVRCGDTQRFASLADVDQKGVRVIYNNGGTNEAFARRTIKTASLESEADNLRVFARLVDGDVDVFFTDNIEATVTTGDKHKGVLCTALAHEKLAPFVIAVLGRRGSKELERFDAWLADPANQSAIETVLVVTNSSKP
ncbi:MAG: transporter substrate-binding domain-containing protein [Myxococcota bacterium]